MLKIWEKMADNSAGHAHDIYQYAISRNSLIRCAALYARWSQSVELAGAHVEARRVLLLARSNCAVPLKIINDAEDDLEMREMRRHLQERSSDEEEEEEETRKAFTNLPGRWAEPWKIFLIIKKTFIQLWKLETDFLQLKKNFSKNKLKTPEKLKKKISIFETKFINF